MNNNDAVAIVNYDFHRDTYFRTDAAGVSDPSALWKYRGFGTWKEIKKLVDILYVGD